MRVPFLLAGSSLLFSVQAIFFTNPTTSTVWQSTQRMTLDWDLNSRGSPAPSIASFIISNAERTAMSTLATNYSTSTLSLPFPASVQVDSPSNRYIIAMVDSSNLAFIYTQVGPFEIRSFAVSPRSSSSSSPSTISSTAISISIPLSSSLRSTSLLSTSISLSSRIPTSTVFVTSSSSPPSSASVAASAVTTRSPANSLRKLISRRLGALAIVLVGVCIYV